MKNTYPISKRIYVKLFPYLYKVAHFLGQDAYVKIYDRKIYFDPNTDIGQKLLRVGNFERAELSLIEKYVTETTVAIDIGANIGTYSVFFANLAVNGKVFAFEPSKNTYQLLLKNIQGIQNIFPINTAVSNKFGISTFYNSIDNAYSGLKETGKKPIVATENVLTVRLDEFIEQFNVDKIDFIKIDVEGNENEVIEGSIKTLAKFKPVILVEISEKSTSNPNPENTINKIIAIGYTPYLIKGWNLEPYLKYDNTEHNYLFLPTRVNTQK